MTVELWDAKYLPKKQEDYIYQDENQKKTIQEFLDKKYIPNLVLSGHRGTGKTSLVYLLKNSFGIEDTDFLKINGSAQTGKDVITSTVQSFISVLPMSFDYKIVFIDEADRLSPAAQDALKGMRDEYIDNARFIFTSNKPHKLIAELRSRALEIEYKSIDKDEMTLRFATILQKEKVKFDNIEVLDDYVNACYPDFRKLLITAQGAVSEGKLRPFANAISDTTEFMVRASEFIEKDNWEEARTYLAANVPDDNWEDCYRFLYDYLHEIGKFADTKKWKAGIVIVADHLYRHAYVADPELNFTACLIRLSEV
jgi:replication factor C small subunit